MSQAPLFNIIAASKFHLYFKKLILHSNVLEVKREDYLLFSMLTMVFSKSLVFWSLNLTKVKFKINNTSWTERAMAWGSLM